MESRKLVISVSLAFAMLVAGIWLLLRDPEGTNDSGLGGSQLDRSAAPQARANDDARDPSKQAGAGKSDASNVVAGEQEPQVVEDPLDDRPIGILGTVSDASQKPVSDASVVTIPREEWEEEFRKIESQMRDDPMAGIRVMRSRLEEIAARLPRARTNETGDYVVRGIEPGEYRVIAAHPDHLSHREETWVVVFEGEPTRYDMALATGRSISGRVLDPEGKALARVAVEALPIERARLRGFGKMIQTLLDQVGGQMLLSSGEGETDEDGSFTISSLEPRLHDLRFELEGYRWRTLQDVPSGSEGIVVQLERAALVTGRVISPGGEPVEGADVVLQQPRKNFRSANPMALMMADLDILGERTRRARTNESGKFELAAFRKGSYELEVTSEEFPSERQKVRVSDESVDVGDIELTEPSSIRGKIVAESGVPIAGAKVVLRETQREGEGGDLRIRGSEMGPDLAETESDERGRFEFGKLADGAFDLRVEARDFAKSLTKDVPSGTRELVVTLSRGLMLTGRVFDAKTEEAIEGAKIHVGDWRRVSAISAPDGRFEVRGASFEADEAKRNVRILASHDLYGDEWVSLFESDIEEGAPLSIAMTRQRFIRGIVYDENGDPQVGARVWSEIPGVPPLFRMMEGGGEKRDAITDGEGVFELPLRGLGGIGRGGIEIVATASGYAETRSPFVPAKRGEEVFVEIKLSRGSAIVGVVRDTNGAPVAGAQIRATRDVKLSPEVAMMSKMMPQTTGRAVYTNEEGRFRYDRIEPGSYKVETRAVGYAKSLRLGVEVGESPEELVIELDPGASLKGRVVDVEGRPFPGAEVVVFWVAEETELAGRARSARRIREEVLMAALVSNGIAKARTGEDGRYELTNLPAGNLRVVAREQGHEPARSELVAAGEELPDLVLARLGSIRGRVIDAQTGAPVPEFELNLAVKHPTEPNRYERIWEQSGKKRNLEGRFHLKDLPAEDYRIEAKSDAHASTLRKLRLPPGGDLEIEVLLDVGATIEGVVFVEGIGRPIAGAQLTCVPKVASGVFRWEQTARVLSGEDGRFLLEGISEGSFVVSVEHSGYYSADGVQGIEFTVPFEREPLLEFRMRRAGRVTGTLTNIPALDREKASAQILLIPFPDQDTAKTAGGDLPAARPRQAQGPVRPDGSYDLSSVVPGRYRVQLMVRQFRSDGSGVVPEPDLPREIGEVEVEEGKVARFDARVE